MEPTLRRATASSSAASACTFRDIERGDILVFSDPDPIPAPIAGSIGGVRALARGGDRRGAAPRTTTSSSGWARCPGQTWEIRRGSSYVDGAGGRRAVPEPPDRDTRSFGPETVPDGMLLMLGDNRLDVRGLAVPAAEGGLGYVPIDKVIGQGVRRSIWPPVAHGDGSTERATSTGTSARLRAQGFARIAGVDEAGRGALAGPLVAAAVILPEGFDLEGIRDSKMLTAPQREDAVRAHRRRAPSSRWLQGRAGRDRHAAGCTGANIVAAARGVRAGRSTPDYVLTDGFPVPRIPCPSLGDQEGRCRVSASVAAASIVAKVTRDRIMRRLHRGTRSSASITTRATARRTTWRPWNGSARRRSTACRSRP